MDKLAQDYLKRASVRLEVLKVFYNKGDYADVVREAQEVVEPVLNILLPAFHLEKPNSSAEFRIGKLLTEVMGKIKEKIDSHQIESIATPAWVKGWTNIKNVKLSRDKLVCNVCGKGFYCKGDDEKICETCKDIRSKGRVKEIPQTVFIDEIAWNPDEKQYENVCLLIAKFDLDEWLNGRFVQSLFIRQPKKTSLIIITKYKYTLTLIYYMKNVMTFSIN